MNTDIVRPIDVGFFCYIEVYTENNIHYIQIDLEIVIWNLHKQLTTILCVSPETALFKKYSFIITSSKFIFFTMKICYLERRKRVILLAGERECTLTIKVSMTEWTRYRGLVRKATLRLISSYCTLPALNRSKNSKPFCCSSGPTNNGVACKKNQIFVYVYIIIGIALFWICNRMLVHFCVLVFLSRIKKGIKR